MSLKEPVDELFQGMNNQQIEKNKKILKLIDLPDSIKDKVINEKPLTYFQFKQYIRFIRAHIGLFFYYPVELFCEGCHKKFFACIYSLVEIYKKNTYYICRGCNQLMYHGHLTLTLIHHVRQHIPIKYEEYLLIKEYINCQDLLVELECKICHKKKIVSCNILNRRKRVNFERICNDCIRACSDLRALTGYYKDIYFESAFELAFIQAAFNENLPIKRCNICISYFKDNKEYTYYPDFQINNTIIEIKGKRFLNEDTELKSKIIRNYCIKHKMLFCLISSDMIKRFYKRFLILNQSYFLKNNTNGLTFLSLCNGYLNEHSCKVDKNNKPKEPYIAIIYFIENLITSKCIFNYYWGITLPSNNELLDENLPKINKNEYYKYKIRIISYERTIGYLFLNLTFYEFLYLSYINEYIPLVDLRNKYFNKQIQTRMQRFKYINASSNRWNNLPNKLKQKIFIQLREDFLYLLKIDVYKGTSYKNKIYFETLYPYEIGEKYGINYVHITDYIIHHICVKKQYWFDYTSIIKEIRKY